MQTPLNSSPITKLERTRIAPCPQKDEEARRGRGWRGSQKQKGGTSKGGTETRETRRRTKGKRSRTPLKSRDTPARREGPRSTPPRTSPKQICERRASFSFTRPPRGRASSRTVRGHRPPPDKAARATAQSTTGRGHTSNAGRDRARSSTHPLPMPLMPCSSRCDGGRSNRGRTDVRSGAARGGRTDVRSGARRPWCGGLEVVVVVDGGW
jgi:hypothetical protein